MAVTADEKSPSLRGTIDPGDGWVVRFSVSSTRATTGILPIEIVKIPRPQLRRHAMPVSEAQVGDALGSVIQPTLRRPLADLGIVRRVQVDGGRVEVLAAVLQEDDPDADELVARIRDAVGRLEGVQEVAVPLTILPAEEQTALGSRLRDEQGGAAGPGTRSEPGQRLGHEEGRPNAFSAPSSRTRVLGITSGKGGVGKSSVTVNLAISLAKMGKEV